MHPKIDQYNLLPYHLHHKQLELQTYLIFFFFANVELSKKVFCLPAKACSDLTQRESHTFLLIIAGLGAKSLVKTFDYEQHITMQIQNPYCNKRYLEVI